jgi:tetratricopeptide (TPR) repeat protein
MGAFGQAEQFFRQSLTREPDNSKTLQSLILCLQQQERPSETLELLERLELNNPEPQVSLSISLLLDKLGRSEEAAKRLGAITEQQPGNINAWLAFAHNRRSAGKTDEAIRAYRRAIDIDFERGDAWWGLASIRKQVFTDDDIATMQKAIGIAIDITNLAPLHFALARAWHERKDYERAFHHYSEGNRIRAEALSYDATELTEEISQTELLFVADFFQQQDGGGDPSDAPVFIVSLPRSGSTLLEQMLGSHPDIDPLGELPYVPALLRTVMEKATRQGIPSVPEAVRAMSPADRTALGKEYLRRASLHRGNGKKFTDKLPHNWSNILLIRSILPRAKFIDIRRAAMDCCFANFTQSFSRAHSASFALGDIGRCYRDYVRLMDHLDRVSPGMVHHVRYEELIEAPEPILRGIFDYLDLEWHDAPLKFHESDRVVRTPSAEQVRRPLNREGVQAWKPYSDWLGPLREALGPLADD